MNSTNKPSYNLQELAKTLLDTSARLLETERELLAKLGPNADLKAKREFINLRLSYKILYDAAKQLNEVVIPVVKEIDQNV